MKTHWKECDYRISWISEVLSSLEAAFTSIENTGNDTPWFDGQFQIEHAEAIYGVSFVTAQVYILGVTQDMNDIRTSLNCGPLNKIVYYKDSIFCDQSNTPKILLVNAAANYYKHNDEWGEKWPTNHTTKILADVGITNKSEFPCFQVAKILFGEKGAWKFKNIVKLITDWRGSVLSSSKACST